MQRSDNYACAADVFADALKAFLPAESVTVSEWAARNRWMANDGGGYVGMWSHAEAPYLTAPMDSQKNFLYRTTAISGPGQCGKTETAQNDLGHSVDVDPGNMLWYSATEFLIRSFVKTKINSMIEVNQVLRSRLGHGSADNSLSFKRFGSMSVEFLPATNSTMISKSAPRIKVDEYDAVCEALGIDPKPIFDVRRQSFGERSNLTCISHPDLADGMAPRDWKRGIMAVYRDSTRKIWYWQCPECGAVSSPNPTATRVMTVHYNPDAPVDEIADMARLLCPVNGCLIEDSRRRAMNLTGQWIGLGQEIDEGGTVQGELVKRDTDGYWIVGLMSPFIIGGIGKLAAARVQAERDYAASRDADSRKGLRQVLSKQWGIPMARERDVMSLDANVIAARAEKGLILGTVANGVRFITVFVDVQTNRFEVMVRGWGERGESWVIDFRVIQADTAVSPGAWDDLLVLLCETAWPLADGSGMGMRARVAGFDSGGAPGTTAQAYDAWRRYRRSRKARLLGKIDGRHCWNVLPMKGASGINAARLQVVYPDTQRKDRFVASSGDVPLGLFNPNQFKDDLAGQLARAEAGPWAVHFPYALRADFAAEGGAVPAIEAHPFFEGLVAEQRKPNGAWVKVSQRNEPLDLAVGTHALAYLTGINRIDWAAPPPWARAGADNPNIVSLNAPRAERAGAAARPETAQPPVAPVKRSFSSAEYAAANAPKAATARSAVGRVIDSVRVKR